MNYRFDGRSKDQFLRDIEYSTRVELELLERWLDYIEKSTGKRPSFVGSSPGRDGRFLTDKEVDSDADFQIDGFGLIEIKFSKNKLSKNMHFKKSNVNSYIKQNASILMFNGSQTTDTEFVLIDNSSIISIRDFCEVVNWYGFGGKLSYRVPLEMFEWEKL